MVWRTVLRGHRFQACWWSTGKTIWDDALPEKGYSSHLFSFLVDGCVRVFQSVSGLERHLYLEACSHAVEPKTLLDIRKEEYAKRLEEGIGAIPTLPCGDAQSSPVDILPKVKGWALKKSRRRGRFSEKQKAYLASKSNIGIISGTKMHSQRNVVVIQKNMFYCKLFWFNTPL